jgi:peptidoglycan/xylan/chitin deacetylase (PgdA/CDA1 family)
LIFFVGDFLYRWIQRSIGKESPGSCIILFYHAIEEKDRYRFARQMDYILRWTNPIAVGTKEILKYGYRYAAVTFDDGFVSVIENAIPETSKRNIPVTIFVPTGNFSQHPKWISKDKSPYAQEIVMSIEQVRKLNENPLVDIGSHCVSHINLLSLNDEEIRRELVESRKNLESLLNQHIRLLSFPHGAFNKKIVQFAKEAGYMHAFSIMPELALTKNGEYISGRIVADPADWKLEFRLKLMGAYRWLPLAFSLKHRLYDIMGKRAVSAK